VEGSQTLLFYDGHCGLCHRAVKFALRHDPDGSRFRFAPLQGTTFRSELSPQAIEGITDSIAVLGVDGSLLQESDAVLVLLKEIGGGWRALGSLLSVVPRFLRDLLYRCIAGTRYHLFDRPEDLCPTVPDRFERRFLP
jgi:predicted DCC family thiol-disulfide oxidoreductase YuxK